MTESYLLAHSRGLICCLVCPPCIFTADQEINILLKNVEVSKACGYDGIGNMILKICADSITSPLCKIINESFSQGVFPLLWKIANVLPLFKRWSSK